MESPSVSPREIVSRMTLAVALTSLALVGSYGCGGTTAGIASAISSGGGGSGGGTNSPAAVVFLDVSETRTAPARIAFRLADPESDPVDVEIRYSLPGDSGSRCPTLVPSLGASGGSGTCTLRQLATSPDGADHVFFWDFVADLPDAESLHDGLHLGIETVLPEGDAREPSRRETGPFSLGNDPPSIDRVTVPVEGDEEASGFVVFELTVSDSGFDPVDVTVEYEIEGGGRGFRPARSATVPESQPTPDVAIQDVQVHEQGTDIVFLWNVIFQEGFTEGAARLRFSADDGTEKGEVFETPFFRIDNNSPPRVQIQGFGSGPDPRGGIAIPFIATDGDLATGEPADEAGILFQWRSEGQAYPAILTGSPEQLRALLRDPIEKRRRQICIERPTTHGGRAVRVDARRIRLPELASSASPVVTRDPDSGLPEVRGELQLLRDTIVPQPVRGSWSGGSDLTQPVAAIPLGDGTSAVVLEALPGAYRLRVLELATGRAIDDVSSGAGAAQALTRDPLTDDLLMAIGVDDQTWSVRRIRRSSPGGQIEDTEIARWDGSTEGGTVRGIVSLGRDACLLSVGSSLIRLDFPEGAPVRRTTLFGPGTPRSLDEPWGLARHPLLSDTILVAEHGMNRILRVGLDDLRLEEVVALGPTWRSGGGRAEADSPLRSREPRRAPAGGHGRCSL